MNKSYRSVKSSVVTDLGKFDDVTKSSLKRKIRNAIRKVGHTT